MCVAMGVGQVAPSRTNSLFLSSDSFMSTSQPFSAISQLQVDDKTDENRVQYSLESQADWDPRDFRLGKGNCGALLGLAAVLGLIYAVRDRWFAAYR